MNDTIRCLSCSHAPFATYRELAVHIMANRKGHQRGRRWASKYLFGKTLAANRRPKREPAPQRKEDRANRESARRQLSGKMEVVQTLCSKCFTFHQQALPVEYSTSPTAWRKRGNLVVACRGCL